MIQDMINLWNEKGEFFLNLLVEHIQISMTAIVLACMIGLCIGILISEFQKTSKLALSIINFIYTIPSISLLGFLIPFSGIGNKTAIITLTVYALLPMVRNTYTGLNGISPAILEAAKGMGSTRLQILYKIKLPLALPIIMSGIRNMAVMTIALAGIASFIGAGGLGVAIYRGITTNNKAMTILGSLLIAFLALFFDLLLGSVEKQMQKRTRLSRQKRNVRYAILILLCTAMLGSYLFQRNTQMVLHMATKPMSEQYILGEMAKTLIEQESEVTVEITQGVGGGTSNIQPGMVAGEFDFYPEYTGTGWNQVLKEESLYTEDMFTQLQEGYSIMHMRWVGMLGFNNTYSIALRKDIADTYQIQTFSDLANVADQLTFGAEYDFFEREDGYDALCKEYNLQFKDTMDLDIGLKYDAIKQKKIDVMVVFTTDGQLSVTDITVLKDDHQMYPSYTCGFVVRDDILAQYPELQSIFDQFDNLISDAEMADMNYQVETQKKEPKEVADAFLHKKGLSH